MDIQIGETPPIPKKKPSSSAEFVPDTKSLEVVKAAAETCVGCDLFQRATQVVFGKGPKDAELMLIGEQPGDQEDRVGKPFVGPAGYLLNEALKKAQIDRNQIYVTNAVKHFKWFLDKGNRRRHQTPSVGEVRACNGWLMKEIELVKPKMIVCLGRVAAQSLFGAKFGLVENRGKIFTTPWAPWWMATYHPAALLHVQETDVREQMHALLEEDLSMAAKALTKLRSRPNLKAS